VLSVLESKMKKLARFWIKQLAAVMSKASSRNSLERANKFVVTINSSERVSRALNEISDGRIGRSLSL
jgi:hypothetical protein